MTKIAIGFTFSPCAVRISANEEKWRFCLLFVQKYWFVRQ
ncbi:hypothetical protein D083_2887 [Dickeya solani RNS 08.23.3.1.A]|nr:hypothetical protein D083_2887 [Dickeya solani RNS 08.23.3.1.A]